MPSDGTLTYECLACDYVYEDDAYQGCPSCGSDRRRYLGPLEPHPRPAHRYGGAA